MPEITYFLRFTHYDSYEIETQAHINAADAWNAFRLFVEPDSFEIYSRIELVEYNWTEKQEYSLAQLTFLA